MSFANKSPKKWTNENTKKLYTFIVLTKPCKKCELSPRFPIQDSPGVRLHGVEGVD